MKTILVEIQEAFQRAAKKAFQEDLVVEVTVASQEEFGHYQCNSPLAWSRERKKAPREVAKELVAALDATFFTVAIAGPGFVNITLTPSFLAERVREVAQDPYLGATPPLKREKILVEFSSPNVAKELHVGHLRSTILGDCFARLFEFLGQEVVRLNHIGDWGTQFGMLIAYMKEEAPLVLEGKAPTDLEGLMRWYRAAKVRFDADELFKKRAHLEVVRLQAGEKDSLHAWKLLCDISREGFQEIYDLLEVEIEERGESFYNPDLPKVVEELEQKGFITISDGAKCLYVEGFLNREGEPMPLMVQKSDGGYNYDTTDLAAIRHRIFEEKADRIIYVTDAGQSLHFQLVFAAAKKVGWLDPEKVRVDHASFGLVLGGDGKKFKTRSGNTEKLLDLLTEGIERARKVVEEKSPDMGEEEAAHLARVLGIGAIKYADLASARNKDYTFSYERMLRFEGNTAVFLLYAFVRMQGILRKTRATAGKISIEHPSEISLAVHLCRFGECLGFVVQDLLPHRLAEYLYQLAEKFHAFFRDCHVAGTAQEASRRFLCEVSSRVLAQGLSLLGVRTVDRM